MSQLSSSSKPHDDFFLLLPVLVAARYSTARPLFAVLNPLAPVHLLNSTMKVISIAALGSLAIGVVSAILGGEIVGSKSDAPYMANFRHDMDSEALCGGVLISFFVVLTTASCLELCPSYVSVGTLYSKGSTDVIALPIKSNNTHPQYNSVNRSYDFALVMLDGSHDAPFIQLPLRDQADRVIPAKTQTTALGWGSTDPNNVDAVSDVLHSVVLSVLDDKTCLAATGFGLPAFMCAQGEAGSGLTKVDQGGPLIMKRDDGNDELIGLVSTPSNCDKAVIANIGVALEFIYNYLSTLTSL